MNRDLCRRFYQMAGINILANLTEPLAGLIAIAFLGHLAEIRYLAGVNLASILFNYIFESLLCLRVSTTVFTAQCVGRNNQEEILLVGLRNAFMALVIGITIVILQYPMETLGFMLLDGSPDIKASGLSYFSTRIWGTPAVLVNFVIIGWFLGREENGKVFLLTTIGNILHVVLSYIAIIEWKLGSQGAGIAQASSEYLIFLIGVFLTIKSIEQQILPTVITQFWDKSAFRVTISFSIDLLLKSLIYISIWTVFFILSATLGSEILSGNTLLQQVIYLIMYVVDGIGFTTETLIGNLKDKKEDKGQLLPVLQISLLVSMIISILSSGWFTLFPEMVFGLLTNNNKIIEVVKVYVPWLFPILNFFSIAWILEGYFAGLSNGKALRNSALVALLLGFLPAAFAAWANHSNHILWLSMSAFMTARLVVLLVQLPETFTSDSIVDIEQI